MLHKIKKQVLTFGFLFLALVAMVGLLAVPAGATGSVAASAAGFHMVQGEVQSVAAPSLVVLEGNKRAITVTTDAATQYFIIPMGKSQSKDNNRGSDDRDDKKMGPSTRSQGAPIKDLHIPDNWKSDLGWMQIFDHTGSFGDIAPGDRVIVRADNANLAKQIMVLKGPVNRTIKGTVVLTDATHITLTPAGGTAIVLNVTAATEITLRGQTSISGFASAVYNSVNNNALVINVQPAAPAPPPAGALKSLAITPGPSVSLTAGSTQQFTAVATYANNVTANVSSQVAWLSSDITKATISAAGLATGVAAGTTNITASLSGKTSPAVVLTVAAAAPPTLTSFAITPSSAIVQAGLTQQFVVTGSYSDGTTAVITNSVAWTSSDLTKAAITSAGGLATGIAAGTTNITASLSGISRVVVLTVGP